MGIHERKEREKERRREEILDAAQKVFFEKGLAPATMDEIADAAELSKATLYLHFVSKEDLYLAVTMRGLKLLHSKFHEIIGHEQSVVKTLHLMKLAYLEFFHTQRNYVRMLSFFQSPHFHKQVSEEMSAACAKESDRNWEQIIGLIARGIEERKIRSDISPAEMAIVIWSNASSLMMRADNEYDMWKKRRNINLYNTLETSFRLTIDAILTPESRIEHQSLLHAELSQDHHQ
jgi:TetR/AcrR family transcriptional regulator